MIRIQISNEIMQFVIHITPENTVRVLENGIEEQPVLSFLLAPIKRLYRWG